jgi:chemotaxis signal transduction protein
LVDEVLQVYRLAEAEIEPAHVLGGDQPAHIAGIGRPEGALLILIDLKPILER